MLLTIFPSGVMLHPSSNHFSLKIEKINHIYVTCTLTMKGSRIREWKKIYMYLSAAAQNKELLKTDSNNLWIGKDLGGDSDPTSIAVISQ